MTSPRRGPVTQILSMASELDRAEALDGLLPLVYDELRAIARARLRGERPEHTLQTTALVHEAHLRLVGGEGSAWNSRAHFFHAAAEAMRRILVEHARSRKRLKRGGDRVRIDLDAVQLAVWPDPDTFLAVEEAIRRLEEVDDRPADFVGVRYFAGLDVEETARALDLFRADGHARVGLREGVAP